MIRHYYTLFHIVRELQQYKNWIIVDVFIHENFRGHGLGKWLVQSIIEHPDLSHVRRWLLATDDAHGLYQQFDFAPLADPEKWMQRLRPFPGE